MAKNYYDYFDFRKELLRKVEYLLKFGAVIDSQDSNQWTALHYAAQCGYLDVVSLLLTKGAKGNIKNKEGKTSYESTTHKKIRALLKRKI